MSTKKTIPNSPYSSSKLPCRLFEDNLQQKQFKFKVFMKKLLKILVVTSIACAIQSALLISSQAEVNTHSNLAQSPTKKEPNRKFSFSFNNTYDYAACLDIILLAYEKRNAELKNAFKNDCAKDVLDTFGKDISKDDALKLVKLADLYATEKLTTPLYPALGLRRRIAINLGYVYDTDKNNPDILKYIEPDAEKNSSS